MRTFDAVCDSTVRIGGAGGTVDVETKIVDRLTLAFPEAPTSRPSPGK